ncbi:MAG: hypothetical protein ACLQPD_15680 [Desulfomonilaceae bacterium]
MAIPELWEIASPIFQRGLNDNLVPLVTEWICTEADPYGSQEENVIQTNSKALFGLEDG